MVENIAAYEHHQREQHRQRLQREGRDIDDMFPAPPAEPMPALEKLAEFVDGMEQRAEAHYREILDGAQANGIDIDGPAPPTFPARKATNSSATSCFNRRVNAPMRLATSSWGKASARCTRCI